MVPRVNSRGPDRNASARFETRIVGAAETDRLGGGGMTPRVGFCGLDKYASAKFGAAALGAFSVREKRFLRNSSLVICPEVLPVGLARNVRITPL
jgi:hypothetical protein